MPRTFHDADFPPCWLSFSGPAWVAVLAAIAVASYLVAGGRGRWWLASLLTAASVIVGALTFWFAPEEQQPLLETWDLRGPYEPWKNSWLKPLEGAGYGVHNSVKTGEIQIREDSVVVGIPLGPCVYRNQVGLFLAMTGPLAVALLLALPHCAKRRGAKAALSLAGGVLAGGVVAAGLFLIVVPGNCWGAVAALLVAVTAAVAIAARRRLIRRLFAAAAGLLAVAGAALFAAAGLIPTNLAETSDTLETLRVSAEGRLEIWGMALEAWSEAPLAGCGRGGLRYAQAEDVLYTMYYAHNEYLHVAAESGLAGLAVLAIAAAAAVRTIRRRLGSSPPGAGRILLVGACTGLIALAVHSSVDFAVRAPINGVVAAAMLGLAAGINRPPLARRTVAVLATTACSLALLGAGWLAVDWRHRLQFLDVERAVSAVRPPRRPPRDPEAARAAEVARLAARDDLAVALAAAEDSWSDWFADRDDAMMMATGYLQLSEGGTADSLEQARAWLQHAQAQFPLPSTAATLRQIERTLSR